MPPSAAVLDARLRAWGAEPAGEHTWTPSSALAAGTRDGGPVVLKVALVDEEVVGNGLMARWAGRGAVPVLEHDGEAILMVRATGGRDLASMARSGADTEATGILVEAVRALHATLRPEHAADLGLVPLRRWFRDLVEGEHREPLLRDAAAVAQAVLAATTDADVVVLHGDVHHGNVLDLGERWGAIDPKGLLGHRAFDYGNLFCNPDTASARARLEDRLALVADRSGLERSLLERWVVAWCGLSLAWLEGEPTWHDAAARSVLERLLPRL